MEQYGVLKQEEQTAVKLRALYQNYGYQRYKMGKFEEYDFYARNKDFLVSEGIITFTDTNGRLMALKPDVTLSIIKNCHERQGYVQKSYYQENVYRISSGTNSFKEILQAGLECIGDLSPYDICETVLLAMMSLKIIAGRWTLDLSHMGILTGVMDHYQVPAALRATVMACLRRKNVHELEEAGRKAGLTSDAVRTLLELCTLYAPLEKGIAQLERLCPEQEAAIAELRSIAQMLKQEDCGQVHLDFSVANDMKYYSGITFSGFIEGVPGSVLSGGVYDNLMQKLGKQGGGIGFAVYLDQLERYGAKERLYDVDTLLLYGEQHAPADVAKAVQMLMAAGGSVLAERSVPENLRCRQIRRLSGKGVELVAGND